MQKGTQLKKMKVVLYAFCILFLCITFKLLYEQFFNHEYILERAENLWQRDFKISGKRGTIYTKDEEVLAINMPSTSVVVVPLMIKDYEKTASILSNILECDEQALLEKIKKRVSTQKLQPEGRNISDEQRNKIIDNPVYEQINDITSFKSILYFYVCSKSCGSSFRHRNG
mgnify:CR=1 FL=1